MTYKFEDFKEGDSLMPTEDWLRIVLDAGDGRDSLWKVVGSLESSQSLRIKAEQPGIVPSELWIGLGDIDYKA